MRRPTVKSDVVQKRTEEEEEEEVYLSSFSFILRGMLLLLFLLFINIKAAGTDDMSQKGSDSAPPFLYLFIFFYFYKGCQSRPTFCLAPLFLVAERKIIWTPFPTSTYRKKKTFLPSSFSSCLVEFIRSS